MERATREEWLRRVRRWTESGLTAKEFAAETGINANSLNHWKWKLLGGGKERAAAPTFVEVLAPVAPAEVKLPCSSELSTFELVFPSGLRLRVPPGFDGPALRRLVDALEVR